jgi:outer membrane protein
MRATHPLRACLLGLILLAAGCAVDNRKEVAQYRRVLDANHLPATRPASESDVLTLPQAMALANENNEQLLRSGEDYVQALINKNRAVANFLPTVSFQPSYSIVDASNSASNVLSGSSGTGVNSGGSSSFRTVGNTLQRVQAPVVGTINLFRGGADTANLRASEQVIAQRRYLLLDLQATVLLNVSQTYYQILRSERSAEVLQDSLRLQEARLHDVEVQIKNGLASSLTLSQTRSQLAATHVQLTQALSDARNGRSTLAQLIGWHDVPNPLADTLPVPPSSPLEPVFESLALVNRQDVLAAEHELQAAEYNVKVAVAQYYPSVDLNLQALLYATNYSDTSKWNALLSANLPIFSAGIIEADVRTAWSQLRQAALDESAAMKQAIHDVQTAYENLATSDQSVRDLTDEVRQAQEQYRLALQGFRSGLTTNLDVLVAQNQMLDAQLQLSSEQFDRTVFYLDLERATGQLIASVDEFLPATQPTTAPATTRPTHVTTTRPTFHE